jgi:hypothetical protein
MTPVFLLLVACGDTKPCADCPAIDGIYAMNWGLATGQACSTNTFHPATLELSQAGSVLRSQFGHALLQGALFDSYDFTLTGGSTTRYQLRGRAVVSTKKVDAGLSADGGVAEDAAVAPSRVRLVGTLTTAATAEDGGCNLREEFTGDRQP